MKKTILVFCCFFMSLKLLAQGLVGIEPLDYFTPGDARTNAAAYYFSDGRLVYFGGDNADITNYIVMSNSLEYDFSAFAWTNTPRNMVRPRTGFAHTQLPNSNVLAFGGYTGVSTTNTCEKYIHSSRSWSAIAPMNEARVWFSAVLLNNGKVLVAGGTNTRRAELYDPVNNTWSSAGSTQFNHERHASLTLLPDGKALLLGDANIGSNGESKGELYDPASNSWTSIIDTLNEPRRAAGIHLMDNGKVLISGGLYSNKAEVYNPVTMNFDTVATMIEGKSKPAMFTLRNGNVLVYGRVPASIDFFTTPYWELYYALVYDVSANSWYNVYGFFYGGLDFPAVYKRGNGVFGAIGGNLPGMTAGNLHVQMVDSSAVFIESADLPQLGLSPNPASDYVRVSLGDDFPLDGEVMLHDMLGRVVHRTKVASSEVMVDLGGLGAGVYVAILYSGEGKMLRQGKVVKN